MSVVLAARDPLRGQEAAQKLQDEGLDVIPDRLDVADSQSVKKCARRLKDAGTEVNVLVNNLGAFRTCHAFVPTMMQRGYGRVVNVSSGGGSFGEGLGPAAYAVSKAALNALTVKIAQAIQGDVKINAMCPGWVKTDMGGSSAPRSPEEAVDTLVWLATLAEDGPNGGFFRDRNPIPW